MDARVVLVFVFVVAAFAVAAPTVTADDGLEDLVDDVAACADIAVSGGEYYGEFMQCGRG